jgi:hypothetical protein
MSAPQVVFPGVVHHAECGNFGRFDVTVIRIRFATRRPALFPDRLLYFDQRAFGRFESALFDSSSARGRSWLLWVSALARKRNLQNKDGKQQHYTHSARDEVTHQEPHKNSRLILEAEPEGNPALP